MNERKLGCSQAQGKGRRDENGNQERGAWKGSPSVQYDLNKRRENLQEKGNEAWRGNGPGK